jgi:hypothetical protein
MFPLRFRRSNEARPSDARARLQRSPRRRPARPSAEPAFRRPNNAWRSPGHYQRPHLLLDEPLSNLDAGLRLTMRTEIRRIQREWA